MGIILALVFVVAAAIVIICMLALSNVVQYQALADSSWATTTPVVTLPKLDTVAYDKKMLQLANNGTTTLATSTATSTKKTLWPVKAPYPLAGAILPFHRIVAYYGNFYSKGMGVLGQYPEEQMITKLNAEVAKWNAADPTTPVMPAIEYIDVTAQGSAGKDGKYRLRMPDSQIDEALRIADKVHGIVILDVQLGLSTLAAELPLLETYLRMPNVHLALDPEFAMHGGAKPGTVIGSMDASDINYAAQYLAKLVDENNLPPKILVVHRFTQPMVTHYYNIKPLPEVQIVMDMDGWGSPSKKIGTYNGFLAPEPVQFTGFKLFYKNDILPPSTRLLTPAELLKLKPIPSFIQFQ
ncbi:MAG: hypothetical protein JWM46_390 [Candidatus Kaiserbacteria bacterium]|nr:hypothetical protein [Candidatus Kaiserbacteria bacterium]